jgi:hypothetical protein
MASKQCDCGAVVWCYLDGYRVKPPVVKRTRASRKAKALIWDKKTLPTAKNDAFASLESRG